MPPNEQLTSEELSYKATIGVSHLNVKRVHFVPLEAANINVKIMTFINPFELIYIYSPFHLVTQSN